MRQSLLGSKATIIDSGLGKIEDEVRNIVDEKEAKKAALESRQR
jgi:hypothetical protein